MTKKAYLRAADYEDRTTAAARQLHECEAEHEHEAALLSAFVVRCERVDQLTMFD